LPAIAKYPQCAQIAARLITPFQKAVFAAAMQSLEQKHNPLRFNNFATNLRELCKIMLNDLAPEKTIKECVWYVPKLNNMNAVFIPYAYQVKFAVQAGLPDDFVANTLKIDIATATKKFTQLISRLSAFTHVTQKTFGIGRSAERQQTKKALETFVLLFQTIDHCRSRIERKAESHARKALNFELISNSLDELYEIATHHTIHGGDIEDLTLKSMDHLELVFEVSGSVDCLLQYGSDGDYERGDGVRHEDSYPLTCELRADISNPLQLEVRDLHVDNSSFFK
jgi:hypothetical protein